LPDIFPPNPKNVYHRVVDEIKKSIFEGRLNPGERLPAERVLADMLGELCIIILMEYKPWVPGFSGHMAYIY